MHDGNKKKKKDERPTEMEIEQRKIREKSRGLDMDKFVLNYFVSKF